MKNKKFKIALNKVFNYLDTLDEVKFESEISIEGDNLTDILFHSNFYETIEDNPHEYSFKNFIESDTIFSWKIPNDIFIKIDNYNIQTTYELSNYEIFLSSENYINSYINETLRLEPTYYIEQDEGLLWAA